MTAAAVPGDRPATCAALACARYTADEIVFADLCEGPARARCDELASAVLGRAVPVSSDSAIATRIAAIEHTPRIVRRRHVTAATPVG